MIVCVSLYFHFHTENILDGVLRKVQFHYRQNRTTDKTRQATNQPIKGARMMEPFVRIYLI